jgi:hypothetical protein
MFHAAHRPGSDSGTPSTSTRGSVPTIGRKTAKARNGSSMRIRRATRRGGRPAAATAPARTAAWRPKAHVASLGVATTAAMKATVAAILSSGRERWTGLAPGT